MNKDLNKYIINIKENSGFNADNIVVEHRSNNPKRDYIFVNKKQCKHIPCKPNDMIQMCKELADVINVKLDKYKSVLVIGFAETATAIAAITAKYLKNSVYVMKTTREQIRGSKVLASFEEEHSHETSHKILTYNNNDKVETGFFDYILLIDDEISTGKTVLNLIKSLENQVSKNVHFGVASICNWQNRESQKKFKARGIDVMCLIKGELKDEHAKVEHKAEINRGKMWDIKKPEIYKGNLLGDTYITERLGYVEKGIRNNSVMDRYDSKVKSVISSIDGCLDNVQSVRVVGTGEFMTYPILLGSFIENSGKEVLCHSTTLSAIDTNSDSTEYTERLCTRHTIPSIYKDSKNAYIYNTDEYTDLVIFITDVVVPEALLEEYSRLFNCEKFIVVEM